MGAYVCPRVTCVIKSGFSLASVKSQSKILAGTDEEWLLQIWAILHANTILDDGHV